MSHKSIIYYIYIASLSSVSSNIPYDFYMHNSLRITKTSGIVINLLLIDSNLRAIRNRLKNLKKMPRLIELGSIRDWWEEMYVSLALSFPFFPYMQNITFNPIQARGGL